MNTQECHKCGGSHEYTGSISGCLGHWKLRALESENTVNVEKFYGGILGSELRNWLNQQQITSENIGSIRRRLFMPFSSSWNALVRDETAKRENNRLTTAG